MSDANNLSDSTEDISSNPKLRYHETLDLFQDVIDRYYYEDTIDVYRTVSTAPPTERDVIPQKFRNTDSAVKNLEIEYTEEDLEGFTDAEKREEVGHYAISVNRSPEKCEKEARRAYRKFKATHTAERAEEYKQSRGPYIAKFHIQPQHGKISKFDKKGHANFLLYEGVNLDDVWDPNFPLTYIDYDNDPDNQK
jgi:hypothetical protein